MIDKVTIRGATYEICECGNCGVVYVILETVREAQRRAGGYSYCPNGHQWGFRREDCEEEKTRRERDRLKQNEARLTEEIAREKRWRIEAQAAEQKAVLKAASLKKRAAAGVCPCCNRTFAALQKHIADKHPTFRAEDAARETVISLVKARA